VLIGMAQGLKQDEGAAAAEAPRSKPRRGK
jgi:hypothetical protein